VAKSSAPKTQEKRRRLPADQAKARILEAAQKHLAEGGPDAIRLQDLASDLGISHPAILHHFGSREGLMEALEERTMTSLQADLMRPRETDDALERVHQVLAEEGHARLLAWLVLSSRRGGLELGSWHMLRTLGDAVHQERLEAGEVDVDPEDTTFTVRLIAAALFGEALIGPLLTASAGLEDDPAVSRRFRAWLARLLEGPDQPPDEEVSTG
jgi:AcrR family transcriptional regulator